MKALILAAGFGTRLRPFTETTPKPLFSVAGVALLDAIICNLRKAGCKAIVINTHHLHDKIDSHLARKQYGIPVMTRYEPEILGTGGAIKNVADFWDEQPFMVINSDIVTDIDLKKVYDFHLKYHHPVTLVLYDDPAFNTVVLNRNGFVKAFIDRLSPNTRPVSLPSGLQKPRSEKRKRLTFTGIQVLDPEVLEFIPDKVYSSIIDTYRALITKKKKIRAFISREYYWKDMGTPERYGQAVFEKTADKAFKTAFPEPEIKKITKTRIKGDGSDRIWYRLGRGNRSIVMVDHGIRRQDTTSEIDAFVAIGRHLFSQGIEVPEIYLYDAFSGLVFMEDLGDLHLQDVILKTNHSNEIISYYKSVIQCLLKLSLFGGESFDPAWAYQTPYYDQDLILEKECRYFVDAFLKEYLSMNISFQDLEDDFQSLSEKALRFSVNGFMHRDMQSRNIMLKNNRFYFIDFQGGRLGPIQYDLASLLIDPYVRLSISVKDILLNFSVQILAPVIKLDPQDFLFSYKYCAITRNLQILGAFGYLSRIKKKIYFEKYIPDAIKTLGHNLSALGDTELPKLKSIVQKINIRGHSARRWVSPERD